MDTIEIKKLADGLLETAKLNLKTNGSLMPLVAQIKGDEVTLMGIAQLSDKQKTYDSVARQLRRNHAEAAILINDGYYKTFKEDDPKGDYKQGDYAVDPDAKEGILIAILGKGIEPECRQVPYERGPTGDITFENGIPWVKAYIGIIKPWWLYDLSTLPEIVVHMARTAKASGLGAEWAVERFANVFNKHAEISSSLLTPDAEEIKEWFQSL